MANSKGLSSEIEMYFYSESLQLMKEVKQITRRHAKKLRETLSEKSPIDTNIMDGKEHGVYKNGWRVSTEETPFYIVCTVRQYRRPSLTWILEDGHLFPNGNRTEKQPHIRPNGDAEADLWLEELMNL